MGRAPCCDKKLGLKKGPWSPDEDELLVNYIKENGHGSWRTLPQLAGLLRCGKSCRLRWINYLRPDIIRGPFTPEEEQTIIRLHGFLGNRWAAIAAQMPGRTDNEIKNYYNTHMKKRLLKMGFNPQTHAPLSPVAFPIITTSSCPSMGHITQWETARLEAEARLLSVKQEPGLLVKPEPADHFLQLWNSEVGDSFRKLSTTCQSPLPQTSSSAKLALTSGKVKTEEKTISEMQEEKTITEMQEERECRDSKSDVEDILVGSDSSSSIGYNVPSDMSLQLLLDFPGCEEEMIFYQRQLGTYAAYHDILTGGNPMNCSL